MFNMIIFEYILHSGTNQFFLNSIFSILSCKIVSKYKFKDIRCLAGASSKATLICIFIACKLKFKAPVTLCVMYPKITKNVFC